MILICKRGHKFDTEIFVHNTKKEGDKCGMVLTYDRLTGSTYCQCTLKDIDNVCKNHYDMMYKRQLNKNDTNLWVTDGWIEIDVRRLSHSGKLVIEQIKELLLDGCQVKTGYTTGEMVRNCNDYHLLYRKTN